MHVFVLVIGERAVRRCAAHDIDADESGFLGSAGRHHLRGELERGKRGAPVAPGEQHDCGKGVVGKRIAPGKPALVGQRTTNELRDFPIGERVKLNHAGTADEC